MSIFKKIRAAWQVRKAIKNFPIGTVREGIKSTEFWVAVLVAAIMAANDWIGLGLSEDTITNLIWIVIGYIGSRTVVKGADALTNCASIEIGNDEKETT